MVQHKKTQLIAYLNKEKQKKPLHKSVEASYYRKFYITIY